MFLMLFISETIHNQFLSLLKDTLPQGIFSCIVCALLQTFRLTYTNPEQLTVCHTNICAVRESNRRHTAQRPVAQPHYQPY